MLFSIHFDVKWLLGDNLIKSYEMLNIAVYDIIQNNFYTEIGTPKDCNLCVPIWANPKANIQYIISPR